MRGMGIKEKDEEKSGKGKKDGRIREAWTREIIRRDKPLPPGWEWILTKEPWTNRWERIKVPRVEADYQRRSAIPICPSYWREVEAKVKRGEGESRGGKTEEECIESSRDEDRGEEKEWSVLDTPVG